MASTMNEDLKEMGLVIGKMQSPLPKIVESGGLVAQCSI